MAAMKEELAAKLGGDTKVLYEGYPENVKPFDKTHKSTNIIRAVILTLLGIAFTLLYAIKAAKVSFVIAAFILILFAYIGFAEVISSCKLINYKYYITEHHIVADLGSNSNIVPLKSIEKYEYKKDADGQDYLIIGDVKKKDYSLRSATTIPARMDDSGVCTECVFYAMSDIEKFKKVFEQQLKMNK